MADYSTNDPRGWCGDPSRGAALGRPCYHGEPEGVITVRESPIDRQGYDRNGTYFGVGAPLFWYADDGGEVDAVTRAADAESAAETVRARFPGAVVQVGDPLPTPCWGYGEDPCSNEADEEYGDLCEECHLAEYLAETGEE